MPLDMAPRMPEVLLVCVIHDSPRLRALWGDVLSHALNPLFYALSQLQGSSSRLLIGGVIYRSEPKSEIYARCRPGEAVACIPFLPAPRFLARVKRTLHMTPLYGLGHLDAADTPLHANETLECAFVDALAAAMDLFHAREKPLNLAPFARHALHVNRSPVVARHLLHVLALDSYTLVRTEGTATWRLPVEASSLHPRINTQTSLDLCTSHDIISKLAKRSISIGTVLAGRTKEADARAHTTLVHTAHQSLCSSADDAVSMEQLLGADWHPPDHISVLFTSAEMARLLRKRPRKAAGTALADSPHKRARPAESPPAVHSSKVDQAVLNKILMLQQQQSTMLKNLSRLTAVHTPSSPGTPLQIQTLEQIRQQLSAQQLAIKRQAELVRSGRPVDLNPILQALINIDKEAKQAGIQLSGPSSGLKASGKSSSSRSAAHKPRLDESSAPPSTTSSRVQSVWQGILKWSVPGASAQDSLFTLVVATCGSSTARQLLALPWPNVLTINTFFPVDTTQLQRLIAAHRIPCALLSIRPFPSSLAVRGAENNESNYQMLSTMLEQNHRAAYVPHGDPGCGILIVSLLSARVPSPQGMNAPRLLAMVFRRPIPVAELSASTPMNASNTRGMIAIPSTTQNTMPGSTPGFAASPTSSMPMAMPSTPMQMGGMPLMNTPSPMMPMTSMTTNAYANMFSTPSVSMPTAAAVPTQTSMMPGMMPMPMQPSSLPTMPTPSMTSDMFTTDPLCSLGFH